MRIRSMKHCCAVVAALLVGVWLSAMPVRAAATPDA